MQTGFVFKHKNAFVHVYSFSISRDKMDEAILAQAQVEQKSYQKSGFRKGHVPIHIIVQELLPNRKFHEIAIENLMQNEVDKFLAEHKDLKTINIIFSPPSEQMETTVYFYTYPENWDFLKEHSITQYTVSIDDIYVDEKLVEEIKIVLSNQSSEEVTVKVGDIVQIEHSFADQKVTSKVIVTENHWSVGKQKNEIFNSFINETVLNDLDGTSIRKYFFYPKQSQVIAIYNTEALEITEENVKHIGYDSITQAREEIKKNLYNESTMYINMIMHKSAIDVITEYTSEVSLPQSMISEEVNNIVNGLLQYLQHISNGQDLDVVCKEVFKKSLGEIYIELQKFCHKKALIKYVFIIWASYKNSEFDKRQYKQYMSYFPPEIEAQASNSVFGLFNRVTQDINYQDLLDIINKCNKEDSLSFLMETN